MKKIGQYGNDQCRRCQRDEETVDYLLQYHKIKDEKLQIMDEGTVSFLTQMDA